MDMSKYDLTPFVRDVYWGKSLEELQNMAKEDGHAAFELGERFRRQGDVPHALEFYTMAKQQGDTGAPFQIACLLDKQGEYTQAAAALQEVIDQDGADALDAKRMLGLYLLHNRLGLFPNRDKEGANLLLDAAKQGMKEAQFALAIAYRNGDGVEVSKENFFLWLRCAQRNHYPPAEEYVDRGLRQEAFRKAWMDLLPGIDAHIAEHDEYLALERLATIIAEDMQNQG